MDDEFFTLYRDLDREGPGEPEDIAWVADKLALSVDANICDAGCGSGGDLPSFLSAAPHGRVTAVDSHKPFIDEVLVRVDGDPRVIAYAGNMAKLKGPFDLIWSAGAVYFMGIEACLAAWRPALTERGAVAFTHPCHFVDSPSDSAVSFWGGTHVTDVAGIDFQVRNAGYETVAHRRISDTAWAVYYSSLQARINSLRPEAGEALEAVLDTSQREIDHWAKVKDETGYLLSVVRPA